MRYCLFLLLLWSASSFALEPFKLTFDLYYKWLKLGKGTYELHRDAEETYLFSFESDMRFLIYHDTRKVKSSLRLQDSKIIPLAYQHKRKGTGRHYEEQIHFLPEQDLIDAHLLDEEYQVPYDPSIQDGLSAQLQLMLDIQAGVKEPSYPILETFGVKQRVFRNLGEETIKLHGEELLCILVEVKRPEKEFSTKMWFARDKDYLPVQLIHFAKGKKQFSAKLRKEEMEAFLKN